MTITKKLELAARLKGEMDAAIEMLMKRDGLTRAAAVDKNHFLAGSQPGAPTGEGGDGAREKAA